MRRLRENTVLDTEIGKSGEVTVEGHVIGRLDGFMFAPDASAAGSEAKALNAAAQKALASEIEARATRLSQANTDQIVLANDGVLRWTGDVVGKLIAGDEVLRPRVRIVADDHLTGPARDLVQTRLDLWLKTYIEKQLAPLFSLSAAEDITGMARGVAFQLVESLGVLERQRVSEEVKGLDQSARATLRKYGVRFGAYHIYLPLLLKPAPRALATQLWALKHEPNATGIDDLLHLAGSGRTSIPVNNETPKTLYRTAGYRVTGERAVRVDILERLADLIRPALMWREGTTPKPPGAFDGRSFTVTGAMTSLTGASGEDFASILRSLGYRMDRKPKPPEAASEPKPPEAASETKPLQAAAEVSPAQAEAPAAQAIPPEIGASSEPESQAPAEAPQAAYPLEATAARDVLRVASSRTLLPQTDFFPAGIAPVVPSAEVPAGQPPIVAEPPAVIAEATAPVAADAGSGEAGSMPAAPAEPEMIEVWRPAGRSDQRKPHHKRRPQQRNARPTPAVAGATAEPAAQPAAEIPAEQKGEGQPHPEPRRDSGEKRAEQQDRRERQQRQERTGKREGRNERGDRPPRRDRGSPVDRADRERYFAKPGMRPSKEPDPNSPFAKLAALKQQLEDNAKR
jgi:ATP-dependent RNA helicase SUPV3L1/SUV3